MSMLAETHTEPPRAAWPDTGCDQPRRIYGLALTDLRDLAIFFRSLLRSLTVPRWVWWTS